MKTYRILILDGSTGSGYRHDYGNKRTAARACRAAIAARYRNDTPGILYIIHESGEPQPLRSWRNVNGRAAAMALAVASK